MIEELSGRTAVVTGAGSGIGLALGQRFALDGMNVVLADRDERAVAVAAAELGDRALACVTDVADPDSVEALAEAAFARFGAVHVLCNNAGVSGGSSVPSWELSLNTWRWVLGVNLSGIVHGHRSFLPRMLATGEPGHIVNTASLAGLVSFPGGGAYGPSKHAAVALTELVGLELAQHAAPIGVSVLCPAWVRTGILDDERQRPAELAVDPDEKIPAELTAQLKASMDDSGLDPHAVALEVVAAIRTGRTYVLPNAEWTPAVVERAARIAAGGPLCAPSPR